MVTATVQLSKTTPIWSQQMWTKSSESLVGTGPKVDGLAAIDWIDDVNEGFDGYRRCSGGRSRAKIHCKFSRISHAFSYVSAFIKRTSGFGQRACCTPAGEKVCRP